MRVLVTGSRDWQAWETVWNALYECLLKTPNGEVFTVVHGACPNGADEMASQWCGDVATRTETYWRGLEIDEEIYPANWKRHGKRAGFLRNAEMVNLGADVCLAFIRNNSRGASMTADLAQRAGIRTIIYREV